MLALTGKNCLCGRWVPRFAPKCLDCGRPSPRTAYLAFNLVRNCPDIFVGIVDARTLPKKHRRFAKRNRRLPKRESRITAASIAKKMATKLKMPIDEYVAKVESGMKFCPGCSRECGADTWHMIGEFNYSSRSVIGLAASCRNTAKRIKERARAATYGKSSNGGSDAQQAGQ